MRFALAVAASLVLVVAAGASTQATRVKIYRPLDGGDLIPTLHITSKLDGTCLSGSAANPRSDAWRCSIGNKRVDPCFSDPKAHTWVACPSDGTPFGLGIIRLHLLKPLPMKLRNHGVAGEGNPWALRLAGGTVCTFRTGATFSFHGKRVNYDCSKATFLAGGPNFSFPTWTITLGTSRTSPPKQAQILVAAW